MFKIFLLCISILSFAVGAKDTSSIFAKFEGNADDSIVGIGYSVIHQQYHSDFKGEVISSINYAEVIDEYDNMQDYFSADFGVRFGYYNKAFVYVEAGIDVLELVFKDWQDDDDYHVSDRDSGDGIDGYAALGAGLEVENIHIEVFVKARKIDGDYWQSKHQGFYGAQLSILF
jgi:hypothetical protein